jgi:hypothetical protein
MMIEAKEKPVEGPLTVRIPIMVQRNAKNKDQEETKDQFEPSSLRDIVFSFMTPFDDIKYCIKSSKFAYEVLTEQIPMYRGSPGDSIGYLSHFLHKLFELYEDENMGGKIRTEIKVIMGKVANAIRTSRMPNKPHQKEPLETFGTPTSKKLENFFKYPENSFFFILLIPLIRSLPIKLTAGGLTTDEKTILDTIFSYEALKPIMMKCEAKVTSKPLISINELI